MDARGKKWCFFFCHYFFPSVQRQTAGIINCYDYLLRGEHCFWFGNRTSFVFFFVFVFWADKSVII